MNYTSNPIFSRMYSPYRLAPLKSSAVTEHATVQSTEQASSNVPAVPQTTVVEPAVIIDLPQFSSATPITSTRETNSETAEESSTEDTQANPQNTQNTEATGQRTSGVEDQFGKRGIDGKPLSKSEIEQLSRLRSRDEEVRAHESAHVAAGGGLTSMPTYSYQVGPDGKQYAIGGSVNIDTSPENTPEATIAKAERIERAALAPANPSSQDRIVAQKAKQMQMKARMELAAEKKAEIESSTQNDSTQSMTNARQTVQNQVTIASSTTLSPQETSQGSRTGFSDTSGSSITGTSTPIPVTRIGQNTSSQGDRTNVSSPSYDIAAGSNITILNSSHQRFDPNQFPNLLAQFKTSDGSE
ncbi:MAG: putative metalloprotease CJM1_0395 family protein [Myxococcota bacterium]